MSDAWHRRCNGNCELLFNREERLNYLLNLRGDFLVADLTNSNMKLSQLATRDALTGLANRFSFDQMYAELWTAATAQRTGLSLIMVDVDNFKQIDDTYGHLHGDKVLR
jgi:PleD family two-component response regulator